MKYKATKNQHLIANDSAALPIIRSMAKQEIDEAAEAARVRYITTGAGQAMAYQEKSEEAADFIAAGYPTGSPIDLSSYPFIKAEVDATGKTAQQAADDIVAQRSAWVAIGSSIEAVRLGGKKNVDDAIDEGFINNARDAAIAILDAI